MYFVEYIIKKITQKKEKAFSENVLENENTEYENCEHVFMPIDSTHEILSCSKCGFLVKKSDLRNKNFFED